MDDAMLVGIIESASCLPRDLQRRLERELALAVEDDVKPAAACPVSRMMLEGLTSRWTTPCWWA